MGSGVIRAYNQALTLHMMPINLIGVAISTAAFPSLTERLGEGRVDLFTKELRNTIRVIIWIILPVATIAFFARGYVVNFIKEGGDALMANLLGALVIAILFRSIYHIGARDLVYDGA
jgi:putative peptidoglycan lipid II flippase